MNGPVATKELAAQGAAIIATLGDDSLAQAKVSLMWARETFGDNLVVASSMGDEVLVHLASLEAPGVDLLFLDTGYHFPETLAVRDEVSTNYPVKVLTVLPLLSVQEQNAKYGADLWARNPDSCCAMRKVEPLERGLEPYSAWITGMRRIDAPTRTDIEVISWDARRSKVKVNPLASWSDDELANFVSEHGVIQHPLRASGYASIGCAPCTRAVAAGEDSRAGRWSGTSKTECGLHL